MSEEELAVLGAMIPVVCIILMVVSFAIGDPKVTAACILGQVLLIIMGVALFIGEGLSY